MKIFLSYSAENRPIADRLRGALHAEGHTVFQDREEIKVGDAFHRRIREEIQESDVFLFLASRVSLTPGAYALSELKMAERRWPNPEGHIVVVLLDDVEPAELPGYLGSVSVHRAVGDVVAEVLFELDAMRRSQLSPKRSATAVGLGVVVAIIAIGLTFAGWEAVRRPISDLFGERYGVTVFAASGDGFLVLGVLACWLGAAIAWSRSGVRKVDHALAVVPFLVPVLFLGFTAVGFDHYSQVVNLTRWIAAAGTGLVAASATALFALFFGGTSVVERASPHARWRWLHISVAFMVLAWLISDFRQGSALWRRALPELLWPFCFDVETSDLTFVGWVLNLAVWGSLYGSIAWAAGQIVSRLGQRTGRRAASR